MIAGDTGKEGLALRTTRGEKETNEMAAMRRRNLLRLCVHFVWTTHNRLPLITGDMEERLYRYIEAICAKLGCPVLAIGGMPDHIHLLVALSATCTVADLMHQVKGSSSRFITETLTPGAWFQWRPNYAGFAFSPHDRSRVIAYILNQKQHHADNTLWTFAEQTDEEIDTEKAG